MAFEVAPKYKNRRTLTAILPSGKKVNFGAAGKIEKRSRPTKKHPKGVVIVWEAATQKDMELFKSLGSQKIIVEVPKPK